MSSLFIKSLQKGEQIPGCFSVTNTLNKGCLETVLEALKA